MGRPAAAALSACLLLLSGCPAGTRPGVPPGPATPPAGAPAVPAGAGEQRAALAGARRALAGALAEWEQARQGLHPLFAALERAGDREARRLADRAAARLGVMAAATGTVRRSGQTFLRVGLAPAIPAAGPPAEAAGAAAGLLAGRLAALEAQFAAAVAARLAGDEAAAAAALARASAGFPAVLRLYGQFLREAAVAEAVLAGAAGPGGVAPVPGRGVFE